MKVVRRTNGRVSMWDVSRRGHWWVLRVRRKTGRRRKWATRMCNTRCDGKRRFNRSWVNRFFFELRFRRFFHLFHHLEEHVSRVRLARLYCCPDFFYPLLQLLLQFLLALVQLLYLVVQFRVQLVNLPARLLHRCVQLSYPLLYENKALVHLFL